MRLNKYLADVGVASRRGADVFIRAGAVSVNGKRASLGADVDPAADDIRLHGKRVVATAETHVTIALHKPAGVVTTMRDERGRPSVASLMPPGRRLFPIGRLDAATTGLLLCTSDGELARVLMHPKFAVEREYEVEVGGEPGAAAVEKLGARKVRGNPNGTFCFSMTLRSGKNREIRRACAQAGLRVTALKRTRYGPVRLGRLRAGDHRALDSAEIQALQALLTAHRNRG
ncbi:MAG TPA: pseudouridine synthase [Candidatus Tumulicola sp.]|nr:pseudouridine synthase [Candidatus Tumulicola sp.]